MADNFNLRSFLTENKLTKNTQHITEGSYSDSYDTPAAKAVNAKAQEIVGTIRGYSTALQTIQDAIKQVEQEVGSEATRSEKSTLESHLLYMFRNNMEMEREGVGVDGEEDFEDDYEKANDIEQAQHDIERQYEETVNENKMTDKEKQLVAMVEKALNESFGGHEEYNERDFEDTGVEEGNVDYTMGRKDDPNQLPNPAPELNIPEGDEMADETVIPEYNTIDELMKSIDHGTNKVAEEHKIQEMKKIAEALRVKAKKMEESEHAAHISPKDLKQLATDAAKLEKAAEKLKAAFDKKFNKKEKSAPAPKAEKVEALQEGFFDLRKFLAENRK